MKKFNCSLFFLTLTLTLTCVLSWGFRFSDRPLLPATTSPVTTPLSQPEKPAQSETSPQPEKVKPVSTEKETAKIGFVDMEKIFNEFPETKEAKKQMDEMIVKSKEEISLKEQRVKDLKTEISALQLLHSSGQSEYSVGQSSSSAGQLPYSLGQSSYSVVQSTNSISPSTYSIQQSSPATLPPPDLLTPKQAELKQDQEDLDRFIADTEARLTEWENKAMQGILGKFNQALRKIAEEDKLSIIVDKNSVLYGIEGLDITDRLQKELEKQDEELLELDKGK